MKNFKSVLLSTKFSLGGDFDDLYKMAELVKEELHTTVRFIFNGQCVSLDNKAPIPNEEAFRLYQNRDWPQQKDVDSDECQKSSKLKFFNKITLCDSDLVNFNNYYRIAKKVSQEFDISVAFTYRGKEVLLNKDNVLTCDKAFTHYQSSNAIEKVVSKKPQDKKKKTLKPQY